MGSPKSICSPTYCPSQFSENPLSETGCNNKAKQHALALHPDGLYVCPRGHRDRALASKCGHTSDYFCASWGYETTGDPYWIPSSLWDYITLKRKFPPNLKTPYHPGEGIILACPITSSTSHGWCNTLTISFKEASKKEYWKGRRYFWGLLLYISGRDPGVTFKIKLLKSIPNQQNKVAVGPNSAPSE